MVLPRLVIPVLCAACLSAGEGAVRLDFVDAGDAVDQHFHGGMHELDEQDSCLLSLPGRQVKIRKAGDDRYALSSAPVGEDGTAGAWTDETVVGEDGEGAFPVTFGSRQLTYRLKIYGDWGRRLWLDSACVARARHGGVTIDLVDANRDGRVDTLGEDKIAIGDTAGPQVQPHTRLVTLDGMVAELAPTADDISVWSVIPYTGELAELRITGMDAPPRCRVSLLHEEHRQAAVLYAGSTARLVPGRYRFCKPTVELVADGATVGWLRPDEEQPTIEIPAAGRELTVGPPFELQVATCCVDEQLTITGVRLVGRAGETYAPLLTDGVVTRWSLEGAGEVASGKLDYG